MNVNILNTGFSHSKTDLEKRKYYIYNVITLVIVIIYCYISIQSIVINIIDIVPSELLAFSAFQFINLVILFIALLNFWLNKNGFIQLTKLSLIIVLPVIFLVIMPYFIGGSEDYLWYPYLTIPVSIIFHFVLIDIKDRPLLISLILLLVPFIFFSNDIIPHFSNNPDVYIQEFVNTNKLLYRLVGISIFFFVNATTFFAFRRARKYQEKLTRLNNTKDKFFSIIAHDLRGPFSSFLSMSKLMHEDVGSIFKQDWVKYTGMLYSSADNTNKLLENLLEWARVQTKDMKFEPKDISLNEIIDDTWSILNSVAKTKSIELINNCKNDLRIHADSNMIKTIIRNLVSNSIKFTPEDGKISILCSIEKNNVTICISDTGVGMSADLVEKLFKIEEKVTQPGTNEEKGTGLGLLLVKEFVDKHNGKIWVQSEISIGSNFYVSLPMN
ncbi:MAG: HAMP domain-containing histidine kinase [Reichenbachiella sp.]